MKIPNSAQDMLGVKRAKTRGEALAELRRNIANSSRKDLEQIAFRYLAEDWAKDYGPEEKKVEQCQ